MKLLAFVLTILLSSVITGFADTYSWTNDKGVVSFTDDPTKIPPKFRVKAKKGEDITIQNPKVQQELKGQEEKARQEEITRPRIVPTPDYVPSAPTPVILTPAADSDELPPGRPKSQRIRENIERREGEEKAKQSEEKKY